MPPKDPLSLGLGLGSIGTSLIGGALNAWSTHKTNQMNMKIAQMNNEFNEAMLEKQMDFSREMWNAENEYNTPANQRARFEEAGLNPYMMMDGGNAGNASSASSVGMPTASPVQFTAPQFDTGTVVGAIGQLGNLMTNGFLARQQGIGQGIENQYADAMNQAKLALLYEQINETGFKAKKTGLEWQLMNDTYDNLKLKTELENGYLESSITVNKAQAAVMQWDAKIKEEQLYWLPQEKAAELAVRAQELVNLQLQGQLTEEQCKLMIASTLKTYREAENISQQTKNLEQQYNIEKPNETLAGILNEAYNDEETADMIYNTAYKQVSNENLYQQSRKPESEAIMHSTTGNPVVGAARAIYDAIN